MSALELLLEQNRASARPFGPRTWPRLCVVTCDDASLTGHLEAALGLGAGSAVVIRLPGGGGGLPQEVLQRAVAKAAFVDRCDEVLLLTHSPCALQQLSADALLDALARNKVPRSAVPYDVRDLVGAGRDPRAATRESAGLLRRCAFLPESLAIHVGHLDEATGRLSIVEDGTKLGLARPEDASAHVAGYQAGPAAPAEAQLPPMSVPEVKPFEPTPISVTTTSEVAALEAPLAMGAPGPATPRAPAPTRPPPPPGRHGKQRASRRPQPPQPSGGGLAVQISPGLVATLELVRQFMLQEVPGAARDRTERELVEAVREDKPAEELVKIALRPALQTGDRRYRILDEMIAMKDGLSWLPSSQVFPLLRGLLR